jgi:hypothetical protein
MAKFFAAPSPNGTNHAGLFLNEAGHLIDRHGNRWGCSTAYDSLPSNGAEAGPRLGERQPDVGVDDEGHEHIRDFLRTSGLTDEQINHVIGLIHKLPNPAGEVGRDSRLGMDRLPSRGRNSSFEEMFPQAARVGVSDFG